MDHDIPFQAGGCVDKYCLHWQGDSGSVCSRGGNIESNISLGCKSPAVKTGESVERSRSGERGGVQQNYVLSSANMKCSNMLIDTNVDTEPAASLLSAAIISADCQRQCQLLPASAFDVFDFDIDTFKKPPAMLFHSRIDI